MHTFTYFRQHTASGTISIGTQDFMSLYDFAAAMALWNRDPRWRYWFDELPNSLPRHAMRAYCG